VGAPGVWPFRAATVLAARRSASQRFTYPHLLCRWTTARSRRRPALVLHGEGARRYLCAAWDGIRSGDTRPHSQRPTAGKSWNLEVVRYRGLDVATDGLKGEVHAAWVLEGRAVQDVWIMPRRDDRDAVPDRGMNMYGTTLRSWDPSIRAWRIAWTNPVHGHR